MAATWLSLNVEKEHSARFAIEHFGLSETTLAFIGSTLGLGLSKTDIVHRACNLDDLDSHYISLEQPYRGLRFHAGAITAGGADAGC